MNTGCDIGTGMLCYTWSASLAIVTQHLNDRKSKFNPVRRRIALLVIGLLLISISPFLLTTTCSDVGYTGEPPGGFELFGFTGLTVTYSPDGGVNTCTAGLGPIYLPLGIICVVFSLRR